MGSEGSRSHSHGLTNSNRIQGHERWVSRPEVLQHGADRRAEKALNERYRGRALIGASAFGFWVLMVMGLWYLRWSLMSPSFEVGQRYWLLNDYSAVSRGSAMLFFTGGAIALWMATVTPIVLHTA